MKTKITCFMCRCLISVIDGDKFRFNDHMKNEHDVRHDFDSLIVLSVMTTTEKKIFTKEFDKKLNERISCNPKDNIKTAVHNRSPRCNKGVTIIEEEVENEIIDEVEEESEDEMFALKDNEKRIDTSSSRGEFTSQEVGPPPSVGAGREGVLKCKFCPRYIKQSQMQKHKEENHRKLIDSLTDQKNTEALLVDERESIDRNNSSQNVSNLKRSRSNTSINVEKVPKKLRKSEEEDEDWTARGRSKKGNAKLPGSQKRKSSRS